MGGEGREETGAGDNKKNAQSPAHILKITKTVQQM